MYLDAGSPDSNAMLCCNSLLFTLNLCADLSNISFRLIVFILQSVSL